MPINLGHEFGQAFVTRGHGLQNRRLPSPANSEIDHVPDLAHGAISAIAICLIDDEDVADLQDARFRSLNAIPHARRQQYQRRVGRRGNLDLRLPDTHGLDDRDIETCGVENTQYLRGRGREAAEMSA